MNYAILFKLQSVILGAISAAFLLCLGVAALYDREGTAALSLPAFAICALIVASLSLVCYLFGRSGPSTLLRREAMATIGIGWVLASLFGALPYLLILPEIGPAKAVFESTSGLTTTGASVLDDLESLPRSLHFWRALSQWMGGLGVIVFFVAVLSFVGAGAKVLFSRESSAQTADLNTARVQQGVWRLVFLYLGLSLLCTFAYWLCGLDPFEAIIHMFTTISTGGFSTRSASIAAFANPALEWTAIAFMAIGGTSFPVIIKLLQRDSAALWRSSEVKAYYALLFLFTTAITAFLFFADPLADAPLPQQIRIAAFQVVSIMTTTGYATADFNQWLPVTHILLLLMMVIGGCSGSTAGGTKVIRLLVALKVSLIQIEKAYRSRVLRSVSLNNRALSEEEQNSVVVYSVLLLMVAGIAVLLTALFEPSLSFPGLLSAVPACLFNIGPGLAEIGPTNNFAGLHAHTLYLLSLLMVLGRLELFAILVLFAPGLWKRF